MALEISEITEAPCDIVLPEVRGTARWGRRLLAAIEHRLEKRRSRRTLPELTDNELRDIGLTRGQATVEVSKSWFWS